MPETVLTWGWLAAAYLAAVVVAEALHRLRLSGLAVAAAVATTAWLAVPAALDRSLTTLESRLAAAGVGLGLVGALVDRAPGLIGAARWLAPAAMGATALWWGWPQIAARPLVVAAATGTATFAYAAWMSGTTIGLAQQPIRAAAWGTVCAAASAACLWASGAASLAALALAAAAGAAAVWTVQLAGGTRLAAGAAMALPLAAILALAPLAPALHGHMAPGVVAALAAVALAAWVPVPQGFGVRLRCLALMAAAAVPTVLVVVWALHAAGRP